MLYTTIQSDTDIAAILALQATNHVTNLATEEMARDGFVTVRHDPEVLFAMNRAYPSVIAKDGAILAGYCLVMPRAFRADIPILEPMFQMLDTLSWKGRPLPGNPRWFVMGQVCVAAEYRGQGVFDGMYAQLRIHCRNDFDFTVTEVAERNQRSLRAHHRVGFETFHVYNDALTGETWRLIALEL
jgi:hypothetical protein